MELTWLEKVEAEGFKLGVAQVVEEMRQGVLQRMEQKFGFIAEDIVRKIQEVDSIDSLADLLIRLPLAKSADELVSGG
jgi:hypothetical protein